MLLLGKSVWLLVMDEQASREAQFPLPVTIVSTTSICKSWNVLQYEPFKILSHFCLRICLSR